MHTDPPRPASRTGLSPARWPVLAGVWLVALGTLAALAVLPLAGCDPPPTAKTTAGPLIPIQVGRQTFRCEIAATENARSLGLMLRETLPPDRGMLFVFDREHVMSFWMKNTLIPLDIVFIDHAGKIVAIRLMKPRDETITSSDRPALYALELNAGSADKAGIKEGDTIAVPAVSVQ